MSGVNKVIIVGRLGKDPEIRSTNSGTPVASLSLATSESWVNKEGQKEEKTEWHNVVLWSKLADLAGRYLNKGRQVYIEGKLQTRSWEDQNGMKRYTTEIVANNMQFLDGARANNNEVGGGQFQSNNSYAKPEPTQQQPSNMEIPSFTNTPQGISSEEDIHF